MEKLKDLELRQHNTLGFLKNQVRQTAAVATAAIMKYSHQQSMSKTTVLPSPISEQKTMLVSKVGFESMENTSMSNI